MKLIAREDLKAPAIGDLLTFDDAAFRAHFSGSPVKRIGRDRFIRNVLIAAGNSGDRSLIAECVHLADDASAVVRGMAAWALSRLMTASEFGKFAAGRTDDADTDVRAEYERAKADCR
jgi:epoxyqueuosine reductase